MGLLPLGSHQLESTRGAFHEEAGALQRAQATPQSRHLGQPGHQPLPDAEPLRHHQVLQRRRVGHRHRSGLRLRLHRPGRHLEGVERHPQPRPEVGDHRPDRLRYRHGHAGGTAACHPRPLQQGDLRPAAGAQPLPLERLRPHVGERRQDTEPRLRGDHRRGAGRPQGVGPQQHAHLLDEPQRGARPG